MTNIAIENGPVEIVDLPIYKMVVFSKVMLVYQRVNPHFPMVFLWFSYGCPMKTSIFTGFSY